jgi:hypothetical protein
LADSVKEMIDFGSFVLRCVRSAKARRSMLRHFAVAADRLEPQVADFPV